MTTRFLSFLFTLLLLTSCATAPPAPEKSVTGLAMLDTQISQLANGLVANFGTFRKPKIVITPFSGTQCQNSEFGNYVSEGLIANLGRSGRYSIIERALLDKILDEQKLGMLGVIDDASATKIGKILGVDFIATGTYSVLDSGVKINGRMIAAETGLIVSVAETSVARSKDVDALLLPGTQTATATAASTGMWIKTEIPVPKPSTSPAYGQEYYNDLNARLSKDAMPVTVSIRDRNFKPVVFGVAATSNECPIHLVTERPRAIRREPRYQGVGRKYGFIRLGNTENNLFYFALDLVQGPHPLMYLDRNQNGDLADDSGPVLNSGEKSGIFSAEITLSFDRILKNAEFPEAYKAWVYTNESDWERDIMCLYSKSQLKGTVQLGGIEYLAFLADRGRNDATFTNKGIYIDMNRNGKIDGWSELVEPYAVAEIGNRRYTFTIKW